MLGAGDHWGKVRGEVRNGKCDASRAGYGRHLKLRDGVRHLENHCVLEHGPGSDWKAVIAKKVRGISLERLRSLK